MSKLGLTNDDPPMGRKHELRPKLRPPSPSRTRSWVAHPPVSRLVPDLEPMGFSPPQQESPKMVSRPGNRLYVLVSNSIAQRSCPRSYPAAAAFNVGPDAIEHRPTSGTEKPSSAQISTG